MIFKLSTSIILSSLLTLLLSAQTNQEAYTVTRALFSSDRYDEFAPVFYKNGIVFCSNRKSGSLADYSGSQGTSLFSIFYIDTTRRVSWRKSVLFSKDLDTKVNDGPASFNKSGDVIYFSRNLRVEGSLKNLTGMSNKLGIFSSQLRGGNWVETGEYTFNSEYYNISTPYLSHDGLKLYFASDKPGGFGGSDLYSSEWKDGFWHEPVNLGPVINTSGNESYPFLNEIGEFYFTSDGHPGLGGKDLFVTKRKGASWYKPELLGEPVNSKDDDFGIVMDPLRNEGYFSSDREGSIDIFHVRQNNFNFFFSEPQKENQYCVIISDSGSMAVDTVRLRYVWDFGESAKITGKTARNCFPGPGDYEVNLDLVDSSTGTPFFRKNTYDFKISPIKQPYITSPDYSVVGEPVEFDGTNSFYPDDEITGYFWDFGDSAKAIGERVNHKFTGIGEFEIRLGLTLVSHTTGDMSVSIVSKKVMVLQSQQELNSMLRSSGVRNQNFGGAFSSENIRINKLYSAEDSLNGEVVFQIVLKSSATRISLDDIFFRKVPSKYIIRELRDQETGTFNYIVDQQMSLMATYPSFSELISLGYRDVRIRLFTLRDPAEKELYNIMKAYGFSADNYFDRTNRLTTSGNILLDQIVTLMSKHPNIKLEVGVYTDNQDTPVNNLTASQSRAQLMVNYLVARGVAGRRLSAKGFGESRPVAPNNSTSNRSLNRRISLSVSY